MFIGCFMMMGRVRIGLSRGSGFLGWFCPELWVGFEECFAKQDAN